jgi:hypothetical protein
LSVTDLCDISCTIDVPFSAFKSTKNSSGERIKKLSFEVEMVPSGAAVEFVVYIDGRRQETQNAQVDFQ